jgi:hypothetical protein
MPAALLRQDLLPIGVGYLLVMGSLAVGLRILRRARPEAGQAPDSASARQATKQPAASPGDTTPRQSPARPRPELAPAERGPRWWRAVTQPGWPSLTTHWVTTAIGGYLVLMAIIVLYFYGVTPVGGQFVPSALTGCAALLGICTPLFLAASWLTTRRKRPASASKPGSSPRAPRRR